MHYLSVSQFKMHIKTLLLYQPRLRWASLQDPTRQDIRYNNYNYSPTMKYPIPVKAINSLSLPFMRTLSLCLSVMHTLYFSTFLEQNFPLPRGADKIIEERGAGRERTPKSHDARPSQPALYSSLINLTS